MDVVKARVVEQMPHLGNRTGVKHENLVAAFDEPVGQVGAQKPGAAGDQNSHAF
jgi:hypothetical protein